MLDNTREEMNGGGVLLNSFIAMRRHRFVALAAFILPLLASVFAVYFGQRIYESRAVISLGNLGATKDRRSVLPKADEVMVGMRERYFLNSPRHHDLPYLKSIAFAQKDANLIALVAWGTSPEEANGYLTRVAQDELGRLRGKLEREISEHDSYVKSRREMQARMQEQIAQLAAEVQRLKGEQPVSAQLATLERGRLLTRIDEMEAEIFNVQSEARLFQIDEVRLALEPTLNRDPVRPQPLRYVGLGLIVGLLGVFFVPLGWERLLEARQLAADLP